MGHSRNNIDRLRIDPQPLLLSGENIKTVNNQSILGPGNIVISGGGTDISNSITLGTILLNSQGVCSIGTLSEANNSNTIAIGHHTKANGNNCIVIGSNSVAADSNSIVFGINSNASGMFALILGDQNTSGTTEASYIIGRQNNTTGSGILFGNQNAVTSTSHNKIIGSNNTVSGASGANVIIIDGFTINNTSSSVIIGSNSTIGAQANYSTMLGYNNNISNYCINGIAIGFGNSVESLQGIAIGEGNLAAGNTSVSIGRTNTSYAYESLTFGQANVNYKLRTLALGRNVTLGSASNYKIAIGNGANQNYIDADNNIAIGVLDDDTTVLKGLKIEANAGANKVLTSDANGVASWQAPASSGAAIYIQETEPVVAVGQKALWIQKMPNGTFDFKIIEN